MWHPDQTMRLLLRWSYSTCPNQPEPWLKALPGELGCEQGKPGYLETTLIPGKEETILKNVNFCISFLLVHGRSLSFSPFFYIYVSKFFIFFFHWQWGDHLHFMPLCWSLVHSYRRVELWDPFSQKRPIMGKKDIFHINSILKVVRDRSGLWCSRKNSQLKSMKGWDSKLIARFCP